LVARAVRLAADLNLPVADAAQAAHHLRLRGASGEVGAN
jgi:hypothetical protein